MILSSIKGVLGSFSQLVNRGSAKIVHPTGAETFLISDADDPLGSGVFDYAIGVLNFSGTEGLVAGFDNASNGFIVGRNVTTGNISVTMQYQDGQFFQYA